MFRISLILILFVGLNISLTSSRQRSSYKSRDESSDLEQCKEIWYSCKKDDNCCSGYCLILSHWSEGACQPKGPEGCKELWYNRCKFNDECCTGYCFKESHWREGVCKTKKSKGKNGCQELWYNQCQSDSECCSKFCFKKADWAEGVCKPRQ